MASLIDSLRNVIGDSAPFVKIFFVAVFLFISYDIWGINTVPIVFKFSIWAVTFLYFLGYVLITIHNTIQASNVFMPNCFDFIQVFSASFSAISALSPVCVLSYFAFNVLVKNLTFEPIVNNIITTFVMLIIFSILAVQFLMFARQFKLSDAYNLKKIFKFSGDILAQTIPLTFLIAIFTALVGGSVGYIIYTLFGVGQILNYYIAAYIVFAIMVIIQYYVQLYFEYIELDD